VSARNLINLINCARNWIEGAIKFLVLQQNDLFHKQARDCSLVKSMLILQITSEHKHLFYFNLKLNYRVKSIVTLIIIIN
jgi:hypothetical protein